MDTILLFLLTGKPDQENPTLFKVMLQKKDCYRCAAKTFLKTEFHKTKPMEYRQQ